MSQEALLYTVSTCKRCREGGPAPLCVPYGVTSDVTGVTARLQPLTRAIARAVCLCTAEHELRPFSLSLQP